MRDINRLDTFYDRLKEIHKDKIPDWRFGQFILNFLGWYYDKYKRDVFYMEEDKFIAAVEEYFNSL